jgi:double-stranded uracil-DNA glycosylase
MARPRNVQEGTSRPPVGGSVPDWWDTAPSDVPDVLAPALRVVFVGINPGRVSAAANAHFANPRNDFWRLLHAAGFTSRLYEPAEQFSLLEEGIGVTNAAYRTTPGSGDLRRGDFDGSAERLERIAAELRPGWLAFVGKEAYRGAFGERAELGEQPRRLGDTRLWVLPSTSPANAAVPWHVRRRWFGELSQLVHERPIRVAARALVLDPANRVLLVRFSEDAAGYGEWWALPGGGVDAAESDADALRRELVEECGLHDFELGPQLWTRRQWEVSLHRWGGQLERAYLVRSRAFEPLPTFTAEQLAAEGIDDIRWFAADELPRATAPRELPRILRELIEHGPPREPLELTD